MHSGPFCGTRRLLLVGSDVPLCIVILPDVTSCRTAVFLVRPIVAAMSEVFELQCSAQEYVWGKKGDDSVVGRLCLAGGHVDFIDEKRHYAELWMGAHSKSPSLVKSSGRRLSEWLVDNEAVLGEASVARFGDKLPFLMKVLSINSALSIQVHPSKVNKYNRAVSLFLHRSTSLGPCQSVTRGISRTLSRSQS